MTSHRSPNKRGIDIYTYDHEFISALIDGTTDTIADCVSHLVGFYVYINSEEGSPATNMVEKDKTHPATGQTVIKTETEEIRFIPAIDDCLYASPRGDGIISGTDFYASERTSRATCKFFYAVEWSVDWSALKNTYTYTLLSSGNMKLALKRCISAGASFTEDERKNTDRYFSGIFDEAEYELTAQTESEDDRECGMAGLGALFG